MCIGIYAPCIYFTFDKLKNYTMKRNLIILFLTVFALVFACNKEEETITDYRCKVDIQPEHELQAIYSNVTCRSKTQQRKGWCI